MEVNFDQIPEELRIRKGWVAWKFKTVDGKNRKVPINARTGGNAKSNLPETWSTGLTAYAFYLNHNNGGGIQGIGYVVSESDLYVGIDLDHCRNSETGEINPWGQDKIVRFNSYSEISPSGTGIRIFTKGKLPKEGRKKGDFEIYDTLRFFTITGHHIEGTPLTIEHRQDEINEIHREIFGDKTEVKNTPIKPSSTISLPDHEIITKAKRAKNGNKFICLYQGDINGYPSQSEADLALVSILSFYTQDPSTLDRLFRISGLYGPKWDEVHFSNGQTYGQHTIEIALRDIREVYKGPIQAEPNTSIVPETPPANVGLEFPREIMAGVAGEFARTYSSVLEVPEHFFFMAFLTCFGVILSDRIKLHTELETQSRIYLLLLGQSADDRKSTAINKTVKFFMDVLTEAEFPVCWGVGSAEGLQKRMGGNNPNEAKKLLLCFDEFKSFVSKCKIEASVLLPCINTLFESNRYESQTKKTDIRLDNAHLSILAASTIETYERTWDSSFTDIGFNNRLFLVPGSGQKKYSFPEKISESEKIRIKELLISTLRYFKESPFLDITPEARALYDDWYMGLERSIHSKRLDTYAIRFMSILTVNDQKNVIDEDIIQKVIKLMNWQLRVRRLHDPIDADNVLAKLEEKIRRTLELGPMKDRKLKQNINANRVGLWFYETATRNLQKANEIIFDKKSRLWTLAEEKCSQKCSQQMTTV